MEFEAIIFDMDGLLVDSEVVWQIAETDLIAARGHVYTEEVREKIIGMRLDEFLVILRDEYQISDTVEELCEELTQRMVELIPKKVKAKPGANEIIQYAAENNIPRAIASSSPMAIIEAIVQSQGWGDLIPQRYTADDVAAGKPAPDVYLYATKNLGVEPTKCLALEDSPNGTRAAVAAGMTCYAVPDLSHSKVEAFNSITPHIFPDLHQVLDVLTS